MKKNRILSFLSAGLLLLAGACSDDNLASGPGDENTTVEEKEGIYLSVNFDLPTAKSTRSYTDGENSSNSGTEIGKDYENTVTSVAVVLASNSNAFIAYSLETQKIEAVGTTGRSYRSLHKFSKTDLAQYYDSDLFDTDADGNHKIRVYVFCNPTESLIAALENAGENTEWYNIEGTYSETSTTTDYVTITTNSVGDVIWNPNKFLMSNASGAVRLFPPTLDEWDAFDSEANAFNLSGMNNFGRPNEIDNFTDRGNINVERTAARYDFRDGALDGYYVQGSTNPDKTYNGFKAQTYHVVLDSVENPLVDVFLGKMHLVNMNNKYYYLRRVSNNGRPFAVMSSGADNDLTICGPELPWYDNASGNDIDGQNGNYVVDAWAEWKYSGYNEFVKNDFSNVFSYPFFNEEGVIDNVDADNDRWYSQLISSVLSGSENDNPDSWNADGSHKSYKIWRYLTEGTIPGINSQKNGVSNGIVFKGQMLPAREASPTDNEFTRALLNALKVIPNQTEAQAGQNPLLFSFANHLYSSWDHLRRTAIMLAMTDLRYEGGEWKFSINRSATLYSAVFGTGGFGSITISVEGNDAETADFMTTSGNVTLTDNVAQDQKSPNWIHDRWNHNIPAGSETPYAGEQYEAFRDAVVANNITIYQESYDAQLGGWAYYCYYFYWNRHNDNGKNGVMGPMEFAVVRNNVYKLAVTKIARLGHPRVAPNDPDKPTPNTPDEKADVYITVTCSTLPWVVRENSIEF